MFTSVQIMNSTSLIKRFRWFAQKLKREPQALLITQKGGESLVLVNARIFEDLVHFQHKALNAGFRPSVEWGDGDDLKSDES